VETDFAHLIDGPQTLTEEERTRVAACFVDPPYADDTDADLSALRFEHRRFDAWLRRNVAAHKQPGYAAVALSLKRTGPAPGDATDVEMDAAADLADRYAFGEIRVSHHQNLVLADVARRDLFQLWRDADAAGLAQPNIGLATDIIACPGGDFCSLANARSIPLSLAIQHKLEAVQEDIGELAIKISGCINACGHHHVGHIGVLGVDKHGEEWFQVLVGGRSDSQVTLAEILGKAVRAEDVPDMVGRLVDLYLAQRAGAERFIDTVARLGVEPFREAAYAGLKVAA
jgi:sulfite reductase (NADPH) hemoprotein beta-component